MANSNGILTALLDIVLKAVGSGRSTDAGRAPSRPRARLRTDGGGTPAPSDAPVEPGRASSTETRRIDPDRIGDLRIAYAPQRDGAPDAGEIIWTWVPYEENDGRGKDRPVLVIGRQSDSRVYAVRMTSKAHDGDRDFLSIGTGAWDSRGRESWVDVEQLYSVHERGLRREAAVLDTRRFGRVAEALSRRYGWRTGA